MSSNDASATRKRKQPNGVVKEKSSKKRRRHDEKEALQVSRVEEVPALPVNHLPDRSASEDQSPDAWSISKPIGGKFIDADPLFSPDEKFIIFATESAVSVYSTENSSLIHSLPTNEPSTISSYALSANDPNVLWVSTLEGEISKWSLKDGTILDKWSTDGVIYGIAASKQPKAENEQDTLFTVTKSTEWCINAYRPKHGKQKSTTSMKSVTLFSSVKPLSGLKLCMQGDVVVATSKESLILGQLSQKAGSKLKRLRYTWREIKCNEAPVCFDVRVRNQKEPATTGAKSTKSAENKTKSKSVDVVIGGVKGCLFVFDDIFTVLGHLEKPSYDLESTSMLNGRAMHWHREAVGSVAWSKDGNYIISGGKETVLVLWQLKTGNKQFLPNLESPIQSIVVSPRGSSYAIRLGDNSVMVLSTSELTPTAHVAGLQTMSFSKVNRPEPELLTVENMQRSSRKIAQYSTPAVLHPHSSNRILAAVPGFQNSRGVANGNAHASYLQEYDLGLGRHEGRQAIARNNAISSNLGPEGNRILEPEIKFIQVSSNGKWLATVDEWTIPPRDIKKLSAPGDSAGRYKESRLRFWSRDANDQVWTLNSRVEEPHKPEDAVESGSVLHLTASPSGTKFATIGTDSMVRIWGSKTKKVLTRLIAANDKATQAQAQAQATTETWWTVQYQVPLEMSMATDPLLAINPQQGILAYSQDSSVLAACLCFGHDDSENAIYFIDAHQGYVREVKRDAALYHRKICGLKFLNQYLICLSREAITVWDITTFDLHQIYPLSMPGSGAASAKNPDPFIEVDEGSTTFAIAIPEKIGGKSPAEVTHASLGYRTRFSIYSPPQKDQKPVFTTQLPRLTCALLALTGNSARSQEQHIAAFRRGYVLIDVGAEARIITPESWAIKELEENVNGSSEKIQFSIANDTKTNGVNLEDLQDLQAEQETSAAEQHGLTDIGKTLDFEARTSEEATRPVVQKEQLADVFEQTSQTLPPVKDLFWGVLSLYADKPVHYDIDQAANGADEGFANGEGSNGVNGDEGSSDSTSDSDSSSSDDDDDDDDE